MDEEHQESGDHKPILPDVERQEPLANIQDALTRAHRNLVVWHDSLIDSNPNLFKKGCLLPVASNGQTINYRVSVDPARKYEDEGIIWPLGEPTDIIKVTTTDPHLKGRPRSVVISYQPGRMGQSDAIRSVEVNWNDPDGITGEAAICSQGKIDYILKAGKNNIYFKSPFYKEVKDATWDDRFFQDMGIQFIYDQQGKLLHHYTRLANWRDVLFYYADGKSWAKGMSLPDFPLMSKIWRDSSSRKAIEKAGVVDENVFRVVSFDPEFDILEHGFFNPSMAKWDNPVPINRASEDGSKLFYTHDVVFDRKRDPKGTPTYYTMELPTTFDVIPHLQNAFPATFPGITPLLHGEFGRRLHLEITGPKSEAQKYLKGIVQELTWEDATWENVTADHLRAAHDFLIQPKTFTLLYEGVTSGSDRYGLRTADRLFDELNRTVPLGFRVDEIKAVVKKFAASDALEKLATASIVYGLATDDLRWVIDTIFQGQTELILRSKEKGSFLPDLHRLQASVVNRLPRRGNGGTGKTQEQRSVDGGYSVVPPTQGETAGTELAIRSGEQSLRLGEETTADDYQYIKQLTEVYRTLLISERLYKRGPIALEDDGLSEAGRWTPATEAELATWILNPGSLVFIDEVLARLDHPNPENGQLVMEILSSQPRTEKGPTDPILLVKVPKLDPEKWKPYEVTLYLFPEGILESMFLNNGLASWWRNIARPIYIPMTQLATDGSFERERTNLKWTKGISTKDGTLAAAAKLYNRKVLSGESVDKPSVRALFGKPHRWWQISYGTPFTPTISPTRIVSASTEIDPAIPCGLQEPNLQIVTFNVATGRVFVDTYKYSGWATFLPGKAEDVQYQRVEYNTTKPMRNFEGFVKRWFSIPIRDFTS